MHAKSQISCVIYHTKELSKYGDKSIQIDANPTKAAAELYAALRHADTLGCDVIYVETFEKNGVGAAIMNRLEKAAREELN